MISPWRTFNDRVLIAIRRLRTNYRVWQLDRQVASRLAGAAVQSQPVVFFNASTRIAGISQNAAFSLLTALGLQLAGVPVVNFACQAGMANCVLGTAYPGRNGRPPCRACIAQSRWLLADAPTVSFTYQPDARLGAALQGLSVKEMSSFELQDSRFILPLGALVLPSIRWALRRHHLADDEPSRKLFRDYIQSANRLAIEFNSLLDQMQPRAVVVFNGQFFPEATARWAATRRGLRVISHEVAPQRFSAFFTDGEATAYPIHIPADFDLTAEQNTRLDTYLEQRFQGNFTMAGIRFWPEMRGLDQSLLQRMGQFRQVVPVFTNVIFDTSQPHSNVVFPDMFTWLDMVLEIIRAHPETLFVLRAHPDELRPGKASHESVADWVAQNHLSELPNAFFINADEFSSSYELIQRSKFVMVYNSSIGLEAALMGAVVLCAGRARYTQYPIVFFPSTPETFRQQAEEFLAVEQIEAPEEFRRNARRFLYYQLYRTALPFGDFLEEDGLWPGFVRLRTFSWEELSVDQSPTMRVLVEGIVNGKEFLLEGA